MFIICITVRDRCTVLINVAATVVSYDVHKITQLLLMSKAATTTNTYVLNCVLPVNSGVIKNLMQNERVNKQLTKTFVKTVISTSMVTTFAAMKALIWMLRNTTKAQCFSLVCTVVAVDFT